jgi:hypothetical protein
LVDLLNHCRNRRSFSDQTKEQGFNRTTQGDNWEKVSQIRDKFEYDRERRMRDKAFAPMNAAPESQESRDLNWNAQRRPFDPDRFARD